MRSSLLAVGPLLALALAWNASATGSGENAPEHSTEPAEVAAAEAPAPPEEGAPAAAEIPAPEAVAQGLGPVGYDRQGRPGRIHVVQTGDTLWDISDAYLGTPWVWPSIWKDNPDVANPHLIYPGDRIWITPTEMRRVTAEEAEQLLSGRPAAEPAPPAAFEDAPAEPAAEAPRSFYSMSAIESVGLISREELEAAASIVDSTVERALLHQDDPVYVGLGEGEAAVGDRFTVVRPSEPVSDPDTGAVLGVFVEVLGWLEIEALHPESSIARIRHSHVEMTRGDRLLPRAEPTPEIEVRAATVPVEGKVAFLPASREVMGTADVVYLNRGADDGLEAGSPLEVYRMGQVAEETVRHISVQLPDHVIAKLLVVSAQARTSVAVVTYARSEISTGDRFRSAADLEP